MSQKPIKPALNRRHLFAGAGAVGAMSAAAALLPRTNPEPAAPAKKAEVDPNGGYQVTQHVLRYYQTTKV